MTFSYGQGLLFIDLLMLADQLCVETDCHLQDLPSVMTDMNR